MTEGSRYKDSATELAEAELQVIQPLRCHMPTVSRSVFYVNIKYTNKFSTINKLMFRKNSINMMGLASKLTVN